MRMLGLLIEDVTLIKQRHLTAAVRFRGGATSLKQRLLDEGWLTGRQAQDRLGVKRTTLQRWRANGQVKARIGNDLGEWLYWLPPDQQDAGDTPTTPPMGKSIVRGAV